MKEGRKVKEGRKDINEGRKGGRKVREGRMSIKEGKKVKEGRKDVNEGRRSKEGEGRKGGHQ